MDPSTELLKHLNYILIYTLEYTLFLNRDITKFTYRDLDFNSGAIRISQVLANIELKQDELTSIIKFINNNDLSYLDLPVNYKVTISSIIPVKYTHLDYYNMYEYSGVKLAKSFLDIILFLKKINTDTSIYNIMDYVVNLGLSNLTSDTLVLTNINLIINDSSAISKLNKIITYNDEFKNLFQLYITNQNTNLIYLQTLIGNYVSSSHKPNDLPYIAMV